MKNLFLILYIIFSTLVIFAENSTQSEVPDLIEKVVVEKYYVSNAFDALDTMGGSKLDSGSVTYRIFVHMKPKSYLQGLTGFKGHPLTFKSSDIFYNNKDRGQSQAYNIRLNDLKRSTVGLDTWLTLGQVCATDARTKKTYFGIEKKYDTDGSIFGGVLSKGYLANADSNVFIPFDKADGFDTLKFIPKIYITGAIKTTENDSTIFGSYINDSIFVSDSADIFTPDTIRGVDTARNEVLIAQLTTKGQLKFELNVIIGNPNESFLYNNDYFNTFIYVANKFANQTDDSANYKYSKWLKYPLPKEPIKCGCRDSNYMEFSKKISCHNPDSCIRPIVFGCTDPNACNYDPTATVSIANMCCYPGKCANRNIALVCPNIEIKKPGIVFFPNPTNKTLTINISNVNTQNVNFSIYNVYGTKIFEENLLTNVNNNIDVSGFKNGVYILKVLNTDGVNITQYFVKN